MATDNITNLKESRDILKEMNVNIERYNKSLKESNTYTNKMTQDNAKVLDTAIKLREQQQLSKKGLGDIADLSKKINDNDIDSVKSAAIRNDLEKQLVIAKEKGWKKQQKSLEIQIKMLKGMDEAAETQNLINSAMDAADGLTGGMASKAKDLYGKFKGVGTLSAGLAVGLTAAVAILIEFSGKLDSIGEKFGAVLNYGNELQTSLLASEQEALRLGKSLEDVISVTNELADGFGFSQTEAAKLSASVIDTSVALGIGGTEASQFVGVMSTIGGLTAQTSQDLAKQVFLLGQVEGVAPQAVLRDIANSAETTAKFTDGSGENIARAAIQARKFGMELSDVASSAETLLDYQASLENSLTASAIIGKNINVQKLQEMMLTNDLEGAQKEQHRILKDIGFAELDNVIARKAAAEALGLSVENAAKMVSKTEEAVTLAGELAGQPGFDELVGAKGISNMTKLSSTFKSMGAILVNGLGPALNAILIVLNGFLSIFDVLLEATLNPLLRLLGGQQVDYFGGIAKAGARGMTGIGLTPMAEGGITTQATPAVVGEAGPEAVVPLNEFWNKLDSLKSEMADVKTAVNNLKISTKITNRDLNIIMTGANG